MRYHRLLRKGLFIAIAVFLLPILGCTEAKEPPKKTVKRKIVQTKPTTPSKTVKKTPPAEKKRAIHTRKAVPTAEKAAPAAEKALDQKKIIPREKIEKKPTEAIKKKPLRAEAEEMARVAKAEEKMEIPYIYDPKGRSDPFRPFITEVKVVPVKEHIKRIPLTPLERAELSRFKVVAILSSVNEKYAMVEDGTGKGYMIKVGTYIGQNGGKVTDIFQDHLVVEEQFINIYGEKKTKRIPLKLRRGQGTGGQP